jgi:hypothetical protein
MHTPKDFVRDFLAENKCTKLQKQLLWRDHWAGTPLVWDSARVADIRQSYEWIHVDLVMGNGVRICFSAPLDRAAEFGRFSSGDYVCVSGVPVAELREFSEPYCCLREDATLSPGHPPLPPKDNAVAQANLMAIYAERDKLFKDKRLLLNDAKCADICFAAMIFFATLVEAPILFFASKIPNPIWAFSFIPAGYIGYIVARRLVSLRASEVRKVMSEINERIAKAQALISLEK